MKSEVNSKIIVCCSLFHDYSIKDLNQEQIEELTLFAHDYLSTDIIEELECECQSANTFNEYYSVWYKSISFQKSIGGLIRYQEPNKISDIIMALNCDTERKRQILNILGVVGMRLAITLTNISEKLNRLKIASGSSVDINIYRDEVEIDLTAFSGIENKSQYSVVLQGIFLNDTTIIDKFFERIKGKKGTKVVNEIIALRELKKMEGADKTSNQLLLDEISKICAIGKISAFNSAFDLGSGNTKLRRKREIEEAKKAYQ
ncbi:hypothetical protein M2480_001791 [Parabacteroides sp. PFB2-12]|uniref:hypothetical protein n=1 Tax=unclassified Parabacteroides TaxID=2649774 RepID=UPI00247417F0|nr:MULTISPECIES: hypothetical protein [unclassified Parabacteroides]MDH6343165.1 hypothetical protein [Parabacteroides sp. PM6-13]MDH6390809.1 hypothetical protein [Parabacteroides sp. PFB2-12]